MPGPSSATKHVTRPSFTPIEITICEPAGVYVMALFTRFTTSCTIRRASTLTSAGSSPATTLRSCSRTAGFTWRSASSTISSMSSSVVDRCMPPPSSLVMASRFSTVALSHSASERMDSSMLRRVWASSTAVPVEPWSSSTSALPEMLVSGVRKSCEMERSRLARSCSFLASTAASSRASMARARSSASSPSLTMASASIRSSCVSTSGSATTASTPTTEAGSLERTMLSPERTVR